MATLSLCTIVKNEEKVLELSLRNVSIFADHISLVDTGSTDKTLSIAKKFVEKVEYFKWVDDFASAQNYSKSFIKDDFFFKWDADFAMSDIDAQKLKDAKDRDFDGANLIFLNWVIEYGDNGEPRKSVTRPLIARTSEFDFKNRIHVKIEPRVDIVVKPIVYKDISVLHLKDKKEKSYRYKQSLSIVKEEIKRNPADSRLYFYYAEELIFNEEYKDAIIALQKYLSFENEDEEVSMIAVEKIIQCYLALNKINEAKKILMKYYDVYIKYPRFKLIVADLKAIDDLENSENLYEDYLKTNFQSKDTLSSYDIERFYVHPRIMLGNILLNKGKVEEAYKYFEDALNKTTFNETRNMLKNRLVSEKK